MCSCRPDLIRCAQDLPFVNIDNPASYAHHTESLNGCDWHVVIEGAGPLLILLHGFPYSWYEFRRLIRPLAQAGFRVAVPDLPGYGDSACPDDLARHTHIRLVGDLVALVQRLNAGTALLAGHDVGSSLAFAAAQMRPDVFTGIAMMNTPPALRAATPPHELWQQMRKDSGQVFYQEYFTTDQAIAELDTDLHKSLRAIQFSISGAASASQKWRAMMAPGEGFLDTVCDPPQLPQWMSDQALEVYVSQYRRHGFKGALSPYRCRAINWQQTAFLQGCKPAQPVLFLGGEHDPANERFRRNYDQLEQVFPLLQGKYLIPGAGHSLPEEAGPAVLDHLLPFLLRLSCGHPPNP